MEKVYFYAAPRIVGNAEDWGYSWTFGEYHTTKAAAKKEGLRELEHDDFIIAEFTDKCDAVIVDRKRHDATSKDFGRYVESINQELGLS